MSDLPPEELRRAELRVVSPNQPVRFVSARLSGQIHALQSLWPNSPKRFIYHGLELEESMTFHDYGLRDGDSIIALSHEGPCVFEKVNLWLGLTRDRETFNDCMGWLLNPNTAGEAARLRDLHFIRMERRPRVFMNMCTPYLQQEIEKRSGLPFTIEYRSPRSPSTEALPILWNVNDPEFHFDEGEKKALSSG
jgi:hypothetical protein